MTMVNAAANIQQSFKQASIGESSKKQIIDELEMLKRSVQRNLLTIEDILAMISK